MRLELEIDYWPTSKEEEIEKCKGDQGKLRKLVESFLDEADVAVQNVGIES